MPPRSASWSYCPESWESALSRTSFHGLRGTLDSGATLGDVRNAHRQMSPDRNFAEQRLHHTDFGNGRIGKRAKIILDRGKILRQIGISHGKHRSFLPGVIQYFLQK